MIYRPKDNCWYERRISLEWHLILTYEICPKQVIFAIGFGKLYFVCFRVKFTKELKLFWVRATTRMSPTSTAPAGRSNRAGLH